ncbi:MAG: alanyl-tRNA editing protein [Acidobacteriia bacterium]|nr:alanyl-tRNA editing protein [Terriglobia bacterium]
MNRTERLYYQDCYLREFEARVVVSEPGPRGWRVVLDRTAFYPDSGGQPADRGTLSGLPVVDVIDEGDAIAHIVESRLDAPNVTGRIDWERRLDHMQQHTGQHLLSAAFEQAGEYKTVSFHLGAEASTIDLDSDRLSRRQMDEAEDLANGIIYEDREVQISFASAEEAARLGLRKPTEREGEIRIVEVRDFDRSACGGTHVSRTGAVGLILVRRFERLKGLTRVEFVCGRRALKTARRDCLTLTEAARLFSGALDNVPALITKQSEELRAALRAREKLVKRLAEYEAREIWSASIERGGRRILSRVFAAEDYDEAKMLAHALTRQPTTVALIGVKGEPAALFFAQTPGGAADMGSILKQTVMKVGGKGGGARDFAQGGGLDEERLEEALTLAEGLLDA